MLSAKRRDPGVAMVAAGSPLAFRAVAERDENGVAQADRPVGLRTLQRELRARSKSHRELVDEVRRELALQLLAREETSIMEVAYEVGFARLQAFYRAFARWTGTTPALFRANLRKGAR
jgi:AraC-like DNA-binding protein